jgi:radical SAM protein with 4Fe4S-binding SPASM domain
MRYFHLFQKSKYGVGLRKGAVYNFLKVKYNFISAKISEKSTMYPVLVLQSTLRCNLSCPFCLVTNKHPQNWREYECTPDKYSKILNHKLSKKCIFSVISGGEPLLNEHIDELISITVKNKILPGMTTNGLLLEKKIETLLAAGLCDLQVSIYDNTKSRLEKILPLISPLIAMNCSYVLLKSKIEFSRHNNFEEILELISMVFNSGCALLKFNICVPFLEGAFYNDSETIFEGSAVYDKLIKACKAAFPQIRFDGYLSDKKILFGNKFTVYFPPPAGRGHNRRMCRLPWSSFIVDSNGNLGVCCNMLPNTEERYGNIFNRPELINEGHTLKVRKSLLNNDGPLPSQCIKCANLAGVYGSVL